ncbi:hypothetical protein B0I35DRAFT_414626 [Stachybotrys elegans]|uniref:Uncharacterized protein n=1 Tax=Stachybotrys elegans TaxID=80388 RepID=A0A8K0WK38_9HYPO|nr:hypothetical protein B0I35DRAFT_414626 [Stachybotrys elegans]
MEPVLSFTARLLMSLLTLLVLLIKFAKPVETFADNLWVGSRGICLRRKPALSLLFDLKFQVNEAGDVNHVVLGTLDIVHDCRQRCIVALPQLYWADRSTKRRWPESKYPKGLRLCYLVAVLAMMLVWYDSFPELEEWLNRV